MFQNIHSRYQKRNQIQSDLIGNAFYKSHTVNTKNNASESKRPVALSGNYLEPVWCSGEATTSAALECIKTAAAN